MGVAQLPVAVVGGDHGAGAHPLLEVVRRGVPLTSSAAPASASWTSAMAGSGISGGSTSSST